MSDFLRSHSEVTILLILLATFTLAAVVCAYPWRRAGGAGSADCTDLLMQEAHTALWDTVAQTPQGTWLYSADDYCLWLSVQNGWLHVERVVGTAFVERTPEELLPVTLITSQQSRSEVFIRHITALIDDDRDIHRALLPDGHGAERMAAYDVQRLNRQLDTAEILI